METEDFKLNISFPGAPPPAVKYVLVSIAYKSRPLFELSLTLEEFTLGLSCLQGRPAFRVNFNLDTLKSFINQVESELPTVTRTVIGSHTQSSKNWVIIDQSKLGTTNTSWETPYESDVEEYLAEKVEGIEIKDRR